MQLPGAVSSAVAALVRGPARSAHVLGVSAAAIYLAAGDRDVIAVMAHDSVRLPCGILLPAASAELPLTSIGPSPCAEVQIGGGALTWPSAVGPVVITIVREWPVVRVGRGRPLAADVSEARTYQMTVLDFCRYSDGNPAQWTDLLGRGPGLTPAGDDVLAGLLAGRAAYGPDDRALADAICALAPSRTTALSAALLRHAARGECIPEVAAFTAALTGAGPVGPAAARLLAVGHTSGAALALGLTFAADGARAAATGPGPLDRDGALPAGLATAGAR